MMNKAINTLVFATVDSLTKFKNKLAYYLAIFAMVFGSTFGTFNAANATDTTLTATAVLSQANQNTVGGDDLFLDPTGIVVVTTALAVPTNKISDISLRGDNAAANKITFKVGNTGAIAVASNVDATSGKFGTLAVEFATANTAAELVTMAGTIASSGTTEITVGSATTAGNVLFSRGGVFTADTVVITGGNHANEDSLLKAANAVTTTSIVLDDNLGSATLALSVDANVTIAGTINAATAGEGTVHVLGATKTFSGTIGNTGQIGTLNIDNTAIFNATVSAAATDLITTKTAVFNKAFTGTTVTLNGGSGTAATFVEDVTATDINIAGAGTVTFANIAAKTVTANITESSAGATAVVIADTVDSAAAIMNFSGTIAVDTLTIGATAKAGIGKFTNNVTTAATIHGGNAANEDSAMEVVSATQTGAVVLTQAGSGDAIFKLSGTTAEIVGAITATSDGDGGIVAAGTVNSTFDAVGTAAAKLLTATVNTGSIASFDAAVAANTLTVTGTATFSAADNESEVIVISDGAVVHIDKTLTNGMNVFNEVATTAPAIHAGAKIYMPTNLSSGQTLVMFVGEGDATIGDASGNDTELDVSMQDTALYDYDAALAAADNGSTIVTANAKADTTTAKELKVTVNAARSLKQALTAAISDTNVDAALENAFNNALNGLNGSTANTDTDLAKQVAPQSDSIGGSSVATRAMTGTVQGIVSNRMASLRSGDAFVTGVSAGNGMSANSGFIQAFGSEGEQKNTSSSGATVFGFDTETSGLAIGFDGMTDSGSTIGLSASYSTTDVTGLGTGKSKNAIDSYTVSVYADKATESGYIEGSLTYGINDNTNSRLINVAGLNRAYSANYDSQQVSLKVGGGVPNEVIDGTFLTPFVTATATNINTDAYTEKSTIANDNLRLKVAQDDIISLVGTVGVKAHAVTDFGTPMISLSLNNEFGDSEISSQNTYQGGGTKFKTTSKVEELSATLGLGYSFGNDVTSLNINYEANANDDDYVNQYGSVKIVAKF